MLTTVHSLTTLYYSLLYSMVYWYIICAITVGCHNIKDVSI